MSKKFWDDLNFGTSYVITVTDLAPYFLYNDNRGKQSGKMRYKNSALLTLFPNQSLGMRKTEKEYLSDFYPITSPLPEYAQKESSEGGKFTKMKSDLKVFIIENCPSCNEALNIAARVEQDYSDFINIEVIDITDAQAVVPEAVFATPTFMLNDQIVSLGNPSPKEVAGWVEEVTATQPEP